MSKIENTCFTCNNSCDTEWCNANRKTNSNLILFCDEFNSTSTICKNANVIGKCRSPKKSLKIISDIPIFTKIVKKPTLPLLTDKTDIKYNITQLNNTYSVTNNNNVSSIMNKTFAINNISKNTFAPLAESTFKENQLISYEINDNNIESDGSITSKNNTDDSFHVSDGSLLEDTDEDETEAENTHTYNMSKDKTVNNTLNLTTALSSNVAVCDDRNMYVETSDKPKSKRNMCPYCKKLQTQFTRHLESVHKTEADVEKFRHLPKSKLYVICNVDNNT